MTYQLVLSNLIHASVILLPKKNLVEELSLEN